MIDSRTRVAAVVAAYRPPSTLVEHVRAVVPQVAGVVVVDDGSPSQQAAAVLDALAGAGAHVLRREANAGIAASLNAGIAEARRLFDPELVVTLDQDSTVCPDYVEAGLRTYDRARHAGLDVGLVAAESHGEAEALTDGRERGFALAFDPLQSGTFLPVRTIDRLGPLDEGLVIDGVDSEYTARVRAAGMRAVIAPGCRLDHALGEREPAQILGRRIGSLTYSHHSPARVYYITRNQAIIARRYLRTSPGWVLRRSWKEIQGHGMRLVLGRDRPLTLRAMAAGTRDAVLGRSGAIPDRDLARLVPRR